MTTQRFRPADNDNDLQDFIGTEYYYSDDTFLNFFYTDGVKHFADSRHCYWLLKMIQIKVKNNPDLSKQPFLTIEISQDLINPAMMHLTITDGNDNILDTEPILNQKFEDAGVCLFMVDNVLLLPSEY